MSYCCIHVSFVRIDESPITYPMPLFPCPYFITYVLESTQSKKHIYNNAIQEYNLKG